MKNRLKKDNYFDPMAKKNKVEKSISIKPGGFAVVELFTSEGCSSCPPADEALEAMSKKYQDNVYLLGFHVAYCCCLLV